MSLALMLVLTAGVAAAAKQKPADTPAKLTKSGSAPGTLVVPIGPLIGPLPPSGSMSRTPGPVITPGSPIEDRNTIVPFPVPGETSRDAIERSKQMNVPRKGMTLVGPMSLDSRKMVPQGTWHHGILVPGADSMTSLPERLVDAVPTYPKAARDAGAQGTVMVLARVDVNGLVRETRVVIVDPAADNAALYGAAVEAVKGMRFKPATFHGVPGAAWVGVPVKFTLH